jgi:hypothetical protein
MSDFNLWSVNWKDGMLVSQRHLLQQEKYFEELVRWMLYHLPGGYGLVKNYLHMGDPLELDLVLEGDILRVTLTSCVAVTSAGHLIYVTPTNQGQEIIRANKQIEPRRNDRMGVYLGVRIDSKKEVGEPNPEEEPPRLPSLTPRYELFLGEAPNWDEGAFLQIGEINVLEGQVELSRDFIPPCMAIGSHSKLQNQVVKFHGALKRIQEDSVQAIRQITQTPEGKDRFTSSPLRDSMLVQIQSTAEMIASSAERELDPTSFSSPSQVVNFFKGFFNNFDLFFRVYPALKDHVREEYFAKQLSASQGDIFFDTIEAFQTSSYNHSDLRTHFQQISQLLQFTEGLFKFYAGGPPREFKTYSYEGLEYQLAEYKECSFRQEQNLCYITLDGFDSKSMQNIIVLFSRRLINRDDYSKINAFLGANEDSTLTTTEPSILDVVKDPDRIILKPRMEVSCLALKRLNIILAGNFDTRRLREVSKDNVQAYRYGYLSEMG